MFSSPHSISPRLAAVAVACLASTCVAQSISPTSATREVQANAAVQSTSAFGPWSGGVSSGSTSASQSSDIGANLLAMSGSLHAHWPAGNTASTEYTTSFSVPPGMSYVLSGTMSAFVSSFGYNGPGWSALTLTGPDGLVFSYVIEAFTGSPPSIDLSGDGSLVPGDYTLHFEASGQGFGSSLMTSGVSDASWDVSLQLNGICGSGGRGSCFVSHPTPSCSDANCCGEVCSIDSFCCEFEWDWVCVNEATSMCEAPCPVDLNGSGAVDAGDLAILLGEWGGAGSADFNSNGVVEGGDLAVLLGAWGPC
ncbi:MAG: hypothetical protein JNL80_17925 [Phycisphaerae bacterium]|nr:hypothetical protein [Phycisphaerae bacterium]